MYVMVGSGILFLVFFLLFKAEESSNKRFFLGRLRANLDAKLEDHHRRGEAWRHYFGASSLRLFLHYLLHQFLSSLLFLVKKLEYVLNRLRSHNKNVAKDVKQVRGDGHLSHIAAHKASVALTDEEKAELRERKLHD